MSHTEETKDLTCPSAPHNLPGAKLLGVVLGEEDAPRVAYLKKKVELKDAVDTEKLDIDPGHAFRFSGKCANSGCGQWKDGGCRLGKDITEKLAPVVQTAPACSIRATCRWFEENGVQACLRCPQVTTRVHKRDARLFAVAKDVPGKGPDEDAPTPPPAHLQPRAQAAPIKENIQ